MSPKAFFKLVVFLVTLFLILYIGVNNRQSANFNFPILDKRVVTDAWQIYFGMFALGVLAGALLMVGGGKGRGRSSAKGEK